MLCDADPKRPRPASTVEERKPAISLQSPLDLDSVCVWVDAARAIRCETNPNFVRVGLVACVESPDTDDVTGSNAHSGVTLGLDARSIIGRRIPATFVVFAVILFEFAVR